MANPLLEFDSPRQFQNADGSKVKASGLTKLSADLLAERVPPHPALGEVSYLVLSLNAEGPLVAQIANLEESLATASTDPDPDTIATRGPQGELEATWIAAAFMGASDGTTRVAIGPSNVGMELYDGPRLIVTAKNNAGPELAFSNAASGSAKISRPAGDVIQVKIGTDIVLELAALGPTFTQTDATAALVVPAYTTDDESVAYTGIDNAQGATPYATVADLNALRVAYENERAARVADRKVLNSIIDLLQALKLAQ